MSGGQCVELHASNETPTTSFPRRRENGARRPRTWLDADPGARKEDVESGSGPLVAGDRMRIPFSRYLITASLQNILGTRIPTPACEMRLNLI